MIGNGQKISPIKINLTMVESMLRYSPNPAQTPPITLSLLLYNLFIILYNVVRDWRDVIPRSALPFIAVDDYHQFDQF